MADTALTVATAITDLLGPAAGPLSGGLPVVLLLTGIAVCAGFLPWAAGPVAVEVTEEATDRG